jgi:hypothetical protein
MIKLRRMTWTMNAVHMGQMRNANKILVRKPERTGHLGDLGTDGWITFR